MMNHIRAIIWDCDGCLIDSEIIACGVAAAHFTQAGYPIDTHSYIARFAGKRGADIAQEISQELGGGRGEAVMANINDQQKKAEILNAFETELQPVNGIHTTLTQLQHFPMAIASGSGMQRLAVSLRVTQLQDFFGEHVYSAELVERGKPAPDVFLLAAEKLAVAPESCLVIEDGPAGVEAAQAAGMTTLGFIGASHGSAALAERLIAAGAQDVLSDITLLPGLLQQEAA